MLNAGNNSGITTNNYLDKTMAMFNMNDNEFYTLTNPYANIDCTNYDVKANQLSGLCLTQIASITPTALSNYSNKAQVDGCINSLNADVAGLIASDANQQSSITSLNNHYVKISGVVALSSTVPDVYLHIPASSFIAVRRSDLTTYDSSITFDAPIVFNSGATFYRY